MVEFSCLYFLLLQSWKSPIGKPVTAALANVSSISTQLTCNGLTISCTTNPDGTSLYGCPIPGCSKMYNTMAGCRQHMDNVHVNGGQHKCPFCGKILSSKSSLRNHKIIMHNGNSHWRCPHCNKAFLDKPRLDQHAGTCRVMQEHTRHDGHQDTTQSERRYQPNLAQHHNPPHSTPHDYSQHTIDKQ